jgi:protein gp37
VPGKLSEPFQWSSPRTVFVNSMSDLFQDDVPDEYIEEVVAVMAEANWHTYQVLTKRSKRLSHLLSTKLKAASQVRHIWWGVSVEDQKYGLPRVKDLQAAPAAVKFLSIEPLLADIGDFDISGIDWAIVGGESGHGARPMEKAWVERILKICRVEQVDFFFKQWGGVHKSTTGRMLHGRTYDEMPELQTQPMPEKKFRQTRVQFWNNRASSRWSSQPNNLVSLGAVAG